MTRAWQRACPWLVRVLLLLRCGGGRSAVRSAPQLPR